MICIPRSAISQLFQEDGLMHFLSAKNCDILPHIVLLHIRICACTFIVDFLRLSVDVRMPLEKKFNGNDKRWITNLIVAKIKQPYTFPFKYLMLKNY